MNILYINHYAGSPDYGMEYRPYYLSKEWVGMGHSVTIVASTFSHVRRINPICKENYVNENIDGINYIWCKTPKYEGNGFFRFINICHFLFRLIHIPKYIKNKPDVVIASSTYPADVYFAKRLSIRYGALLVWEVHDLWPLTLIELSGMSVIHPFVILMQHAENYACKNANLIISLLSRANLHLLKHGMHHSKFSYIPNGVNLEEWSDDIDTNVNHEFHNFIEKEHASNKLVIGYAGYHGLANSLDTVLDAAKMLKNEPITWALIGDGPEKDRLRLRILNEEIHNVFMFDPVQKSMIPGMLKMMDVLYLGWRHHQLYRFGISPNKLMDYMMSEKMVIHAVDAGNDPVFESGCGISIPPQNPQALCVAIKEILSMPDKRRNEYGCRGSSYVRNNFSYSKLAKKFIDAINLRKNEQRT